MKTLILAVIVGAWISAIALLSIQNAKGVTLQFLAFKSVEIPFGLVLTSSVVVGMVGTALLLPVLRAGGSRRLKKSDRYENEFYEE
ncbi:MAG: DUF1049 domain-containing protein [Synechococcales cyanobacterium T60_A2020_003]|nr:DUF1049 domain-containing protein [Synechococcales cyanobacterium T60_A2020_003]